MSIFLLGPLIKQKREELGLTQEDLADGICSVPTLSRIENGEMLPNKSHSEMLLQRLGYSDMMHISYVTEKTLELHELKFKIRQAIIQNRRGEGEALLEKFSSLSDHSDCISAQFILIYKTILSDQLDISSRMGRFLKAIRMTCPNFSAENFPSFLSYEEIIAINNYANCKGEKGELAEAIDTLFSLKKHYDYRMTNQEEILRTQLMVLYNLSKFLGMAGRYDECIEICDTGIRISRETRRCSHLDRLYYNKAWAMLKRNQLQDHQLAEEAIRLAICIADGLGNDLFKQHYIHFRQEHFENDH